MSSENEISKLLQVFAGFEENEFTQKVIVPLLRALGYKPDFHGGAYEAGKDIILWKEDSLGYVECGVGQVKKLKLGVSTRTNRSFSDLMNQLQQASEKAVPYLDGNEHLPKRVMFFTPYDVDTRALQSRFEKYRELSSRGVTVIDGTKVAELLCKHCPELKKALIGSELDLSSATLTELSNNVLMQALHNSQAHDICSFYSDLDFVLGKRSASFITNPFDRQYPSDFFIEYPLLERFEALDASMRDLTGVPILLNRLPGGRELHKSVLQKLQRDTRRKQVELRALPPGAPSVSALRAPFTDSLNWQKLLSRSCEEVGKVRDDLLSTHTPCSAKDKRTTGLLLQTLDRVRNILNNLAAFQRQEVLSKVHVEDIRSKLNSAVPALTKGAHGPSARALQATLSAEESVLTALEREYVQIRDPLLSRKLKLRINFASVEAWISSRRDQVLRAVEDINAGRTRGHDIRTTVQTISEAFSAYRIYCEALEVYAKANKQVLKDDIELLEGNRLESEETKYILHVPMRVFFDARLNIAVFGDAGAGKTTTLQMYAKSLIQERRDGLVLFVSLASALSIFKGRSPSYFLTQSSPADLLVQAVCAYINHHAIGDTVDVPTLNKILLRKGGVLLLDGLDEVAKLCPWILEAIAEVPQKYKKLQVITSSRLTGDYVERIPFFGVTIKEFTDSQRDAFIQRWFGETPSPDDSKAKAASVLSHLATHQHVRDIVKNPLSATIMCVLAEKAVQLPQTEVQLYKERFRLLLGDYDLHKGIKRVETHHDTLYKVAVKLAFYLHSSNTRQGASEELQSEVLRILSSRYSPEVLIQAVGELADPCNVLVPMNIQGEYGFGHLRFQEYLAACEIITNRNINWVDYIYSDWWRGAMSLLAQMSDDIEFIFKAALDGSQFGRALPTLNAMLKDKSEKEIGRLDEWIRRINSNKEPSDEEIRERRYQQYRERKDLPLPGLDRDY